MDTHYNFIVLQGIERMKHFAHNFRQEFIDRYNDMADDPTFSLDHQHKQMILNRGVALREFQAQCIESVSNLRNCFDDDDLVEQLRENITDEIFTVVLDVIKDLEQQLSNQLVVSVVPLDFEGTVGFVIQPR